MDARKMAELQAAMGVGATFTPTELQQRWSKMNRHARRKAAALTRKLQRENAKAAQKTDLAGGRVVIKGAHADITVDGEKAGAGAVDVLASDDVR